MAGSRLRLAVFGAVLALVALAFSSCDNSSSNNTPTLKPAGATLGMMPNCHAAGVTCGSDADCCGAGLCDSSSGSGQCNSNSCLIAGQSCSIAAFCCSGRCSGSVCQ